MARFALWAAFSVVLVTNVVAQLAFDPSTGSVGAGPQVSGPSIGGISQNGAMGPPTTQPPMAQQGFGFGTTPSASSNAIFTSTSGLGSAALFGGLAAAASGQSTGMGVPHTGAGSASGRFLEGFFRGYLAKVQLTPGEKSCVATHFHELGKHSVRIIEIAMKVISGFVGHNGNQAGMLSLVGGVSELFTIANSAQALSTACIQGDMAAVLNVSMKHLRNTSYIRSRLTANGPSMMRTLADAMPYAQTKNFTHVGHDVGKLLRKVILSRQTAPANLTLIPPMTQDQVGPTIMNGVIQGIFEPGSNVTITSSVDHTVYVFIDLHRCVAKEAKYFTNFINVTYNVIAQIAATFHTHQSAIQGAVQTPAIPSPISQLPVLMGPISGILGNIPILMSRCGLTTAQRQSLARAMQNPSAVQLAFGIPGHQNKANAAYQASIRFKNSTLDWKAGQYDLFGKHLGATIRDLILTLNPQTIGAQSTQPTTMGFAGNAPTFTALFEIGEGKIDSTQKPASVLALACALFTLTGLTLLRAVRQSRPAIAERHQDAEAFVEQSVFSV